MYNVYKDPEGKQVLDDPTHHQSSAIVKTTTMSSEGEEDYKKRLESLNAEMKVLNDELQKVCLATWLPLLLLYCS